LEEHGDLARAEFIRVQCERSRIQFPFQDPQRWECLSRREQALLREHQAAWQAELPRLKGAYWTFERGFAGSILVANVAAFQREAPRALQVAPIEEVRFKCYLDASDVSTLAAEALLARFSRLDLSDSVLGDQGAATLMPSPYLSGLRRLRLAHVGMGPVGARAVATTAALAGLSELDLSYNHILTSGAEALAASPHLQGLRILHLHHIRIDYRSKTAKELRERFGEGLRW
jgi:hypothetical protein